MIHFAFTYVLNADGDVVPEPDPLKWAAWLESADNEVQTDHVSDEIVVSTIFVGFNYNPDHGGPPLVWETVILGGPENGYCRRFATREQALAGHAEALRIAGSDTQQQKR